MITPLLKSALEPVVARHRLLRNLRSIAVWLAAFTLLSLWLYEARDRVSFPAVFIFIALFIIYRAIVHHTNQWEPDYRKVAREIEEGHPELHALLATAIEQKADPKTGQFGFLQQRVISQVMAESRRANWLDAVPLATLWMWGGLVAVLFAGIAVLSYQTSIGHRRAAKSLAVKNAEAVSVSPGDAVLERGSGLVVLATFHRNLPSEATLVIQPLNQPMQRVPLVKNLDDPVFGGGLPDVDADLTYRIEYAGKATRDFSVKVFEHPRLDRADATLHFPDYTKLPEKQIPDTRRVSAVEGTKLDVAFQLNKPVKSATLVAKDGTTILLAVQGDKPIAGLRDFPVRASQTYELKLEDADGRANKLPAQFIVEALPNRRPELKFQTPKGDQQVTPLQEVAFRAEAWDDFGLSRYGLTINVAGRGEQEVELGRETRADEKREFSHLLKLEELGVKPDELVSWFLWAEDTGPDGQLRRTETDMFFAEVRPFEEIYRRDKEGGEGKGAGNDATKLAELQKQIISATWNLKRNEEANAGAKKPGEKYLKDEPVVRDSQAEALQQTNALGAKIEDPKSRALVENAVKEMQAAHEHLTKAEKAPAPLPDALTAEQAAYNALLKLAAHEFRVSRSKGKGQSNDKKKQQLDQLEMKDEKERYETKREAEPMQNEQQREQLAILNRLKELAQRQQDINARLKELQTALLAAQTEKEKDEIRRQLKRLREEEQQVLADLDETRQKMEQSSQQAQLADERQQLDKARNEAQKTAESMEKGETSQALASGTRTQRDLQQLRDDFRKKTSGQFTEEMRQMRNDARELAQHQQEIAEKLKPEPGNAGRRTLGDTSEREQLAKQFDQQKGDLGKVTEAMKRVSEQAEAAEPLLAKELYDTLRKTTQAGTGETLEKTQLLSERGYQQQAQKFEEKARQEIEDLKTGVERAAESVLGDEAEALRMARAELDALKQQIERELATARPDLAEAETPGSARVPRAGDGVPPSQTSEDVVTKKSEAGEKPSASPEVRPGETPEPAGGTPAPPGDQQPRANASGQKPGEKESGDPQGQGAPNQDGQPKPGQEGKSGSGKEGQGQQPGKDGQGERGQTGQQGSSPGQGKGQGEGKGQEQSGQTAQGSQGQGRGQGKGQVQSETASSAQGSSGDGAGNPNGQETGSRLSQMQRGKAGSGANGGGGMSGGAFDGGPLTGEKFAEWSDRLRNVEEMIDDPNLRTEAARIREIAKGVRVEFKQHSVQPDWDLVKMKIGTPLAELRNRLTEELARRESKESLVPIDRDPVPIKYAERVRRYYEDLGRSGEK